MAQLKRLTLAQKVVLSGIRNGEQPGLDVPMKDLKALQAHGLVALDCGTWQAVDATPVETPVASTASLLALKERFQ